MGFETKQRPPRDRVRNEMGLSVAIKGFGRDKASIRMEIRFTRALASIITQRCDVYIGDGSDEGSLVLHFNEHGGFKTIYIKSEERTYLRCDLPPCAPRGYEILSIPCQIEWIDRERLKIYLPVERWAAVIAEIKNES